MTLATTAQQEAIANADAHLSNAALPTYRELLAALQTALRHAREAMPAADRWQFDNGGTGPEWMHGARRVLRRHEKAMRRLDDSTPIPF